MTRVRLQSFLRDCGVASRRRAEEIIQSGRVIVNGEVVDTLGVQVDPGADTVVFDGRRIEPQAQHLYLFHKPKGMVTTLGRQERKPSIRTIAHEFPVRVFPVGRLDVDASGLLLLTNDGDFAERILHPRFEVPRVYWAVVKGEFSREARAKALQGVELEDGPGRAQRAKRITADARTNAIFGSLPARSSIVELEVNEGRNHFVKRLLKAVGHPVLELCRVQMGPYKLGELEPGRWREISFQNLPNSSRKSRRS